MSKASRNVVMCGRERMDMPRLALCIQETRVMRNIFLYYDSHLLPRDKMPPHPLT